MQHTATHRDISLCVNTYDSLIHDSFYLTYSHVGHVTWLITVAACGISCTVTHSSVQAHVTHSSMTHSIGLIRMCDTRRVSLQMQPVLVCLFDYMYMCTPKEATHKNAFYLTHSYVRHATCLITDAARILIERNPPPRGGFLFTMFPLIKNRV